MEGDPLGPECPPVTSQSGHCPGPGKVAHRAGQPWRDGLVSCTLVSMAAAISSCRATGLPLLPCRAAVASAPAAASPTPGPGLGLRPRMGPGPRNRCCARPRPSSRASAGTSCWAEPTFRWATPTAFWACARSPSALFAGTSRWRCWSCRSTACGTFTSATASCETATRAPILSSDQGRRRAPAPPSWTHSRAGEHTRMEMRTTARTRTGSRTPMGPGPRRTA